MHPYFRFFGLQIIAYDLMQITGFILAASYCLLAGLRLKISGKRLIAVIAAGFFVQFFGGMVIPLIYRYAACSAPLAARAFNCCPGRYFHSSFLFILIYVLLISGFFRWPVRKVMDILMVAVMIMSSVGRIGCFLEGCCGGKPANLPWAMHFPSNPAVGVHPTQIYMFFAELLILGALLIIDRNKKYDGQTFWSGILLYSIYRFWVEYYRTNPVFMLGLTHAQYFSMITFFFAVLYMIRRSR
ncbi:MAG: prolipoprotein diacylglyceryl transferase [Candidatus Omnitrophica bacterium]|nr:prolipoprotein diacylglyceryl transferase [Candidatus Omnitrophota bacterium]